MGNTNTDRAPGLGQLQVIAPGAHRRDAVHSGADDLVRYKVAFGRVALLILFTRKDNEGGFPSGPLIIWILVGSCDTAPRHLAVEFVQLP